MKLPWVTYAVATMAISFSSSVTTAEDGLPTLEEAVALSQQTGRPILAMAGQKT